MLQGGKRKAVINKLNNLLMSYNGLAIFCDKLDNNIDLVVETINKIVKHALANPHFLGNYIPSLATMISCLKNVEVAYGDYLKIRKKRIRFGKLPKLQSDFPLADDIFLEDVDGILLPTLDDLRNICLQNIEKKVRLEEAERLKEEYYRKQKGFLEVGFTYSRAELVRIDENFIYYSEDLTGNVAKDFYTLYKNERYGEENSNNPLRVSYEVNIEKIKRSGDIYLKKLGNVYEIVNGRHRILYILSNGGKELIPAIVARRIEDLEVNQLLIDLIRKFDVLVVKNNVLDDEINLLIWLNGKMYMVTSKEELREFCHLYNSGFDCNKFLLRELTINENEDKLVAVQKYMEQIFKKMQDLGENLLISNFSDCLNLFPECNDLFFYQAFRIMQDDYQKSVIYQYDFKEWFLKSLLDKETIRKKVVGLGKVK